MRAAKTISPSLSSNRSLSADANAKPKPLPKHDFITVAAAPPRSTTAAAVTFCLPISPASNIKKSLRLSKSGTPYSSRFSLYLYTRSPPALNVLSATTALSATPHPNAMSVGGTEIFSNVPDMESLPPIAARLSFICAVNAPSSADMGAPHFSESVHRAKNSCIVK